MSYFGEYDKWFEPYHNTYLTCSQRSIHLDLLLGNNLHYDALNFW